MPISLKQTFDNLLLSSDDFLKNQYSIDLSDLGNNLYVGVSKEKFPCILIKTDEEISEENETIDTSGIKAQFQVSCKYSLKDKIEQRGVFNIVSCINEDPNSIDFFFDFFNRFFSREGLVSSPMLKAEINHLCNLFSFTKQPGLKTTMGLWSELFIIYLSENTEKWANAWHSRERSTFDFKFLNNGFDVKSFKSHDRKHHFQLEQLKNLSVENTYILSMNLQESEYGEGLSVFDLFDNIASNINDLNLIKKIETLLFKLGGLNNNEVRRFNENIAHESLLILRGKEIPIIKDEDIPLGVSEIKFVSDCSNIKGFKFDKEIQERIEKGELV